MKKLKTSVFVQPEVGGIRCLAKIELGKVTFETRAGTPIKSMEHLVPSLLKLGHHNITLAGSLYRNGMTQVDIIDLIWKSSCVTKQIQFWINDIANESPFIDRYGTLEAMHFEKPLLLVPTIEMHRVNSILKMHRVLKNKGYAGARTKKAMSLF